MDPEPLRRPREPRGHRLPAAAQRAASTALHPGVLHDRRGVDRLAGGVAPDLPRRPRLRLQVEHGLDARHPALLRAATRSTAATTTTSSPSACSTPTPRTSSCRSRTTRSCTARARCSSKMPGDHWQQFANLRLLYGLHWTHPGKKLLFMGGEFAPDREWNHDRGLDWHLAEDPPRTGVLRLHGGPRPRSTASTPALWELRPRAGGLPLDRLPRRRAERRLLRAPRRAGGHLVCVLNLTPVPRLRLPHRAARGAAATARSLNTDAALYGGEQRRQRRAPSTPSRCRCTATPQSAALDLPPLAALRPRAARPEARRERAPAAPRSSCSPPRVRDRAALARQLGRRAPDRARRRPRGLLAAMGVAAGRAAAARRSLGARGGRVVRAAPPGARRARGGAAGALPVAPARRPAGRRAAGLPRRDPRADRGERRRRAATSARGERRAPARASAPSTARVFDRFAVAAAGPPAPRLPHAAGARCAAAVARARARAAAHRLPRAGVDPARDRGGGARRGPRRRPLRPALGEQRGHRGPRRPAAAHRVGRAGARRLASSA